MSEPNATPIVATETTTTVTTTPATASHQTFHSVVQLQNLLKECRDTHLYGTSEDVYKDLSSLLEILSNKVTMETSALYSLHWQCAFKMFCLLTGASEHIGFTAVIPYDSELLNGSLFNGRWNVRVDPHSHTMEVSTEPLN